MPQTSPAIDLGKNEQSVIIATQYIDLDPRYKFSTQKNQNITKQRKILISKLTVQISVRMNQGCNIFNLS